jgi:CubicO group peptidase (beta-lactamase class C family)
MRALPLLLTLLLTLPGPATGAAIDDRVPAVEVYLNRLENLGFAGAVLVAEGDRTLLASGFGLADREAGRPWTPQTVSTIGSITKQFTGAAILALSDDGRLRVSDAITKYFPDVPPDKQSITLHQLLTHSSGIVDLEGIGDFDPIGRDEFVRRAMQQALAFPPGEGYEYSNAGYSLLGAIIEEITGASYETFVRERFFLPAGMKDTGYILPKFDMQRLAQGYRAGEKWGTVLEHPMADDGWRT